VEPSDGTRPVLVASKTAHSRLVFFILLEDGKHSVGEARQASHDFDSHVQSPHEEFPLGAQKGTMSQSPVHLGDVASETP